MGHDKEHSDEKQESEREETVQDLDVSKEEAEDVRGGLGRHPKKKDDDIFIK
jgi:hypothetical protein